MGVLWFGYLLCGYGECRVVDLKIYNCGKVMVSKGNWYWSSVWYWFRNCLICGLVVLGISKLEFSGMFRNCWSDNGD